MNNDIAIQVENLSKCYQIYENPRDRLKQFILPRLRKIINAQEKKYFREFWAVKNISIKINRGETIGIIGHNGSGKSTLLQMICGTLHATNGSVKTNGRIAALLELGAGFNPEFTGRENVYLNGSILGLSKEDIDNRFNEIATFADIGDFIEQPVKTYSSGMFVRLAFAVQACVDPEILVVDEALSVGDIGFQYKCFKRMESLRDKGVTIIMVTHSTGTVLEHADRCIVMEKGNIILDTTDVLAAILTYEKGMLTSFKESSINVENTNSERKVSIEDLQRIQIEQKDSELGEKRFGTGRAIIENLKLIKSNSSQKIHQPIFKSGDEVIFHFKLLAAEKIKNVVLGISLSKSQGADVWGDNNLHAGQTITLVPGEQSIEYRVRLPIASGEYLIHCGLACFNGELREELDQRRPMMRVRFLSPREQVGFIYAPIQVFVSNNDNLNNFQVIENSD
ncbi:vitamin B12 import ATP-binding protein BtuD [Comamonadaceae bacterium OS-1]|nr:vitamin B12 import ATP-binding protein BtuD [Comamonadaceae bacterium OS-1]